MLLLVEGDDLGNGLQAVVRHRGLGDVLLMVLQVVGDEDHAQCWANTIELVLQRNKCEMELLYKISLLTIKLASGSLRPYLKSKPI